MQNLVQSSDAPWRTPTPAAVLLCIAVVTGVPLPVAAQTLAPRATEASPALQAAPKAVAPVKPPAAAKPLPPAKPLVGAKAKTPVAPLVLPEPPTPVRQAQEIGLGQCAPVLDLMSRQTLVTSYDVQSGWSRINTPGHIFQSVAALNTPGNNPPDGIAALVAAPVTAGGCDGVALQVFPLAGDCQSAEKTMIMQGGKFVAPMLKTRILLDAQGNRVILLPAFNRTCIAISVETRFGNQ